MATNIPCLFRLTHLSQVSIFQYSEETQEVQRMLGANPTYDHEYYENCMECVCPPPYRGRVLGAYGETCDCIDHCEGGDSSYSSYEGGSSKGSKSDGKGEKSSKSNGKGGKSSKSTGKGEKSSKSTGKGEKSSKSNGDGGYSTESGGKGGKSSKSESKGGYSSESESKGGYSSESESKGAKSLKGKSSKGTKSSKSKGEGSSSSGGYPVYPEPSCPNDDICYDCYLNVDVCYCYQNGKCWYGPDYPTGGSKESKGGSKESKGGPKESKGGPKESKGGPKGSKGGPKGSKSVKADGQSCDCTCTSSDYCTDDEDCYETCICDDCAPEKSSKATSPTPAPYNPAYPTPKSIAQAPTHVGGKGVSFYRSTVMDSNLSSHMQQSKSAKSGDKGSSDIVSSNLPHLIFRG